MAQLVRTPSMCEVVNYMGRQLATAVPPWAHASEQEPTYASYLAYAITLESRERWGFRL